MIDTKKLNKWSKEIYETAVAHGWHEEKHSPEHYLGLIMTEVAEAVEADRKCRCVRMPIMDGYSQEQLNDDAGFKLFYEEEVKGNVAEEFADIVIRLLDMLVDLYGDDFRLHKSYFPSWYVTPNSQKSICENAWTFVKESLNESKRGIVCSLLFMYDFAEQLGIDLDQHIEWKMKYNSLREYKHGGKKY